MKKDVIYIDIEDDITAIIEKLKNSSEKIIALVPPKGNSVLQSIVNLKLLHRAAESAGKRPVVVTGNQALTQLAGGLNIYVAKTLQSKPAIPSGTPIDSENNEAVEVSDEIGELDSTANSVSIDDSDEVELSPEELAALDAADGEEAVKKPAKKSKKIPDFNNFRKKLILIGGGLLLLLILFIGVFGRTKANVVVRAETTPVEIAFQATVSTTASKSNPEEFILKATREQDKKTLTQEFTATGKKDIGDKATGTMTIKRTSVSSNAIDVPVGTRFVNGQLAFVSTEATQLAGTSIGPGGIVQDEKTIPVVAEKSGDKYNLSARSYQSSVGGMNANGSTMSGGTTKIVTAVSQEDFDKAKAELDEEDTSEIKQELIDSFSDDVRVLKDSFKITVGEVKSDPAVGKEADEAELTAEVTYTMLAVSDNDFKSTLNAFIQQEMPDRKNQQVYESGFESMKLTRTALSPTTAKYQVAAVGQYGPKFSIAALEKAISGDKAGEARSYLQELPGVKGVDINLSPFWARQLPNTGRITIKLDVDKNISG